MVQELRGVTAERGTVLPGVSAQGSDLLAPLGHPEKQRQQQRADQQPLADRHVDDHRSGHRSQHEPDGDREDIEDDDLSQDLRVQDQHPHEAEREQRQPRFEQKGRSDAAGDQEPGRTERRCRGPTPGCDRPPALHGVQPVAGAVAHVVDQIHGARQRAEDAERATSTGHGTRLEELFPEHEPREDDEILCPLIRPKRDEQVGRQTAARHLTVQ